MKRKPLMISLMASAVLAVAGYGLYRTGMQRGMDMTVQLSLIHI